MRFQSWLLTTIKVHICSATFPILGLLFGGREEEGCRISGPRAGVRPNQELLHSVPIRRFVSQKGFARLLRDEQRVRLQREGNQSEAVRVVLERR